MGKERGSEFKRDDPPLHVAKGQGSDLNVMTHLFILVKDRSQFKRDDPPLHMGKGQGSDFLRDKGQGLDFNCDDPPFHMSKEQGSEFKRTGVRVQA